MAPPLPNSAHGDQLIFAKSRGTARFLSEPSYLTRWDGLTGWGGGIRTSAYRIGICQDSQPRGQDSNLRISN